MPEVGALLRQWRDRLQPADVGLVTGRGRRAPGLRREEVAQLAGVSVDYLTRMEQGRVPAPSSEVLEALARALRLTADERTLLFSLARRLPRIERMRTELTPSVRRLLEQVGSPMCVYDACWTQLAWNRAFAVLFGDPSGWHGLEANLLYRYLTRAPTRVRRTADQGSEFLHAYVADLQLTHARFPMDHRVTALVAQLRKASDHFLALWERQLPAPLHETRKTVQHPQVGLLDLDCDVLTVEGRDLRVVLFTSPAGSPQADALSLLASLDVTPV